MKFNLRDIFLIIIGLDIFTVILHIFFSANYNFFNLDWESNLPTIYQGLKLVLAGSIFFTITFILKFVKQEKNIKLIAFWLGLSILLTLMGFDEAAQIHEFFPLYVAELFPSLTDWYTNVFRSIGFNSSIWIGYFLPFVPIGLFWLLKVHKAVRRKYGRRLLLLIAGFAVMFLGAFVFEYIGTTNTVFFSNWFSVIMIIEESLEIIGGSLILFFAIIELVLLSSDIKKGQV